MHQLCKAKIEKKMDNWNNCGKTCGKTWQVLTISDKFEQLKTSLIQFKQELNTSFKKFDHLKIVLVILKTFWNSRLKAENMQKFWDH